MGFFFPLLFFSPPFVGGVGSNELRRIVVYSSLLSLVRLPSEAKRISERGGGLFLTGEMDRFVRNGCLS